jgi:hypothetical protein
MSVKCRKNYRKGIYPVLCGDALIAESSCRKRHGFSCVRAVFSSSANSVERCRVGPVVSYTSRSGCVTYDPRG